MSAHDTFLVQAFDAHHAWLDTDTRRDGYPTEVTGAREMLTFLADTRSGDLRDPDADTVIVGRRRIAYFVIFNGGVAREIYVTTWGYHCRIDGRIRNYGPGCRTPQPVPARPAPYVEPAKCGHGVHVTIVCDDCTWERRAAEPLTDAEAAVLRSANPRNTMVRSGDTRAIQSLLDRTRQGRDVGFLWETEDGDVFVDTRGTDWLAANPEPAPVDPRNDPAERKAGCPGSPWCRCAVSTPCPIPAPAAAAEDDPARCGATSFAAPHPFEAGAWMTRDADGYYEYETCLRPADDPIHTPADADPPRTDAPTPAGTYRFEAGGPDGTWTTVGTGGTDFVARGAVALGRQAQAAAEQYRTRTGTLGPVRCTIQVPGGPGASAEAGPVPPAGGRADLPPTALAYLDLAYAFGRVDVPAASRIGDALAALGWLHRGELIPGPTPALRYYPAGSVVVRYAIEVAGTAGWSEVGAGTRRVPVATPDVLDAVATAIADVTDGGGAPLRVSVCAGPIAYAVAYAAATGPTTGPAGANAA